MACLFRSLVIAYSLIVAVSYSPPQPRELPKPKALQLVQPGAEGFVTLEAELARIASNRV